MSVRNRGAMGAAPKFVSGAIGGDLLLWTIGCAVFAYVGGELLDCVVPHTDAPVSRLPGIGQGRRPRAVRARMFSA